MGDGLELAGSRGESFSDSRRGGGCGAGEKLVGPNAGALVELARAATAPAAQGRMAPSYCRMCFKPLCATPGSRGGRRGGGDQGRSRRADERRYAVPAGPCSRVHQYNPYRVKSPLKRTNPNKGLDQDPKWVEISWEEALSTIAKRLQKVRAEDPRKIVLAHRLWELP